MPVFHLLIHHKDPHRLDKTKQRDANFVFLMSFQVKTFSFFLNFRKHISNLRCLVCISYKVFFHCMAVLFTFENKKIVSRCVIAFGMCQL